jgi:hypothetical protein
MPFCHFLFYMLISVVWTFVFFLFLFFLFFFIDTYYIFFFFSLARGRPNLLRREDCGSHVDAGCIFAFEDMRYFICLMHAIGDDSWDE